MSDRWPNQIRANELTRAAIAAGANRICVTSPTGTGKSNMMVDALEFASEQGWQSAMYTNRRMLLKQTLGVLESHGINVGVRASGHDKATLRAVQLCMTQTEGSQVYVREARELHDARLVIVDEAHVQKGGTMERILRDHIEGGAVVVGYTATPIEIGHLYDELIVAGNVSDGRTCGALVPAHTYAPDEPDLKSIKKYQVGEDLSEADNVKAIMRPGIFGRVYEHYRRLNADSRPTILFAPGVKESLWFAEEFHKKGLRAAHIDGEQIWVNGEFYNATDEAREQLKADIKSGEVQIVANRFVMREGIDIPEIYHCIFATVFGALSSYLQSGGRVLREHSSLDSVVVQDHGGNWWRFGSLNENREWSLGMSNHKTVSMRLERLREKQEQEPITCPQCNKVRASGKQCHACGYVANMRSRMVVQVDGSLKAVGGDIMKPRTVKSAPDTADKWQRYYYSQKRAGRTFNQAYAWFFHEEHYWPPKNLPLMPSEPGDWFRKIKDVPENNLNPRSVA